MANLNTQQQLAVDTLSGPLLLLAGAGTGKTTVIVHRIANLIRNGVKAENILAVTFTNKAAREMRERIEALLGNSVQNMQISTFHAFCAGILRRNIQKLRYDNNFTIARESYLNGLIRELIAQEGLTNAALNPAYVLHRISLAKSDLLSPEEFLLSENQRDRQIALLYKKYQERLQQMDTLDFDDLLYLTVQLWKQYPELLQAYQDIYTHLMIDEFQDTNKAQLQLMYMLGKDNGNIAAVGDDDQSIYGWRGANLENILKFEEFFPQAKIIKLEQNYRSTKSTLKSANAVIAKNKARRDKNLWSENTEGEKIVAVRCTDEKAEADFIANYIYSEAENEKWADFAVLFRSNKQARALEEKFRRAYIPYNLVGTDSFYQHREILDAISFLQLVQNPADDFSFLRIVNVPPRGIGSTTIKKLKQLRSISKSNFYKMIKNPSLLQDLSTEAINRLQSFIGQIEEAGRKFKEPGNLKQKAENFFNEIGYLDGLGRMYKPREDALRRKDNVLNFLNSMQDFENEQGKKADLVSFLQTCALQDQDNNQDKEQNSNSVTILTVHASKGLEFPVVMLAGMERNTFPNQRAVDDGNLEEERRLFYVALTRAQKKIIISFCEQKNVKGQLQVQRPSNFLSEIPDEFLEYKKPSELIKALSKEEANKFMQDLLKELSEI